MSVIGYYGSGGGGASGGGGETKVRVPFTIFKQSSSYDASSFGSWDFTEPHYVTSIEVRALDPNGQPLLTPVETRINGLKINGVDLWQDNILPTNNTLHISQFFTEPFGVTKLYLNFHRRDGISEGVRVIVRGFLLQ